MSSATAIDAWQRAHQGDVRYDEEASTRLAYDTAHLTSPTDCSGMAIRMLRHFDAGMRTTLARATYTGNLCKYGHEITGNHNEAAAGHGMELCDLIFFDWDDYTPTWDHVAIYAGHGRIWNHGGVPIYGPVNWSLASNVRAASRIQVRRYLAPAKPPSGPHLRYPWPSWMPKGHVFGNIKGPDWCHGGIDSRERDAVRRIQIRFENLGYAPHNQGWADGLWGNPTDTAAHRWHEQHAHPSPHMLSVSESDWHKLFTY